VAVVPRLTAGVAVVVRPRVRASWTGLLMVKVTGAETAARYWVSAALFAVIEQVPKATEVTTPVLAFTVQIAVVLEM
jgi:hypothetical protein